MRRRAGVMAMAAMLAVGAGVARSVRALEPSEVCVIYNSKSNDSLALARYYANARQIPQGNLIGVICTVGEDMTEEEYRKFVVPQVQKALADHPNVKCLVTTYDVPLRVGAWQPTFADRQEINTYKLRLDADVAEMDKEIGAYEHVAGGAATEPAATRGAATGPADAKRTWQDEVKKLNTAANAAIDRIKKLDEGQRPAALVEFAKVHERVAGLIGLLAGFQVREGTPNADAAHAQMERLQTQLRDLDQEAGELIKDRNNPAARKELVGIKRKAAGLVGEAREIEGVIAFLQPIETESCFDNEIAMVLADQDYPRGRWLGNPTNVDLYPASRHFPKVPRTLLVSRMDGPSVEEAERMIQTGLKTEKAGLEGKIYLDARGIHEGGYAVFDVQLREAAAWLKANSTMECVLDDKPELFKAKDCPNAALYCGWYSPRSYQDSCQWVAGGVGYHVASFEMLSLHKADETGWVVNLLKRGYCGTLGPTAEPYLSSFPNPAHFFPLLLSGEFTQGEVWELTAPMLSWRTGYVGDPLYNPFKGHPRVKDEALMADPVLKNAFAILHRETKAAATSSAVVPAPVSAASAPRSDR